MVNFEAQGDIIVTLKIVQAYDPIKGIITQISKEFTTDTETYRVLAIIYEAGDSQYYKVTNLTKIYINSAESDILDLSAGTKFLLAMMSFML